MEDIIIEHLKKEVLDFQYLNHIAQYYEHSRTIRVLIDKIKEQDEELKRLKEGIKNIPTNYNY